MHNNAEYTTTMSVTGGAKKANIWTFSAHVKAAMIQQKPAQANTSEASLSMPECVS
jgi:hypothetical protein